MNIQTIKNVSDCVPLYLPHSLYLKPFAKFNISVSLPQATAGKAISNWDVMEKLRHIILPDQYSVLKVNKIFPNQIIDPGACVRVNKDIFFFYTCTGD